MPPQVPSHHSHPLLTPKTPLLFRDSPKSRIKQILHRAGGVKMKFTKRKLIPLLLFILSVASIFRFLKITITTTSFPIFQRTNPLSPFKGSLKPTNKSHLTEKETRFLLNFFSSRVPCNLLIFGLQHQYSKITSLNANGVTVFLEDNLRQNPNTRNLTGNTRIYRIMYNTVASEAYQLLKVAREHPHCKPGFYFPKGSKCNLALSNLPPEVYDTKWDVVLVDGPDGGTPGSPGRMAAIYTASVLARRGNVTHVFVHDVDRMIEKWFSREFLCEENLVASKGRFWHFQILGVANATKFCAI